MGGLVLRKDEWPSFERPSAGLTRTLTLLVLDCGHEQMVLDFLVRTHVMYGLIEPNGSQKHAFEEIPNLYGSVQRCSDQLERVLRAQNCRGDHVRVALVLRSG